MDYVVVMCGKTSSYAKYKYLPKKSLTDWSWIAYSPKDFDNSPIHKLIWKDNYPQNFSCISNYSTLFEMIINHDYAALSSSIIKKSQYYKSKSLALIQLPEKKYSYCILAVKKERKDDFLIQNFVKLIKSLFVD